MSTALTAYVDGDVISAAALRATFLGVETWLNETSTQADTQATAWVAAQHPFPPYVFGAPAPRFDAQTCLFAHRQMLFSQRERTIISNETATSLLVTPVVGLAARVRVLEASTPVLIKASWFSYSQGGSATGVGDEATLHGKFDLYVDGAIVLGTTRRIYLERGYGYFAKKQHGIVLQRTLNAGTHDIGVYLTQVAAAASYPTFIEPRGFSVKVQHR